MMETLSCEYVREGLNIIVFEFRSDPKGVFILYIGGDSKKKLYKMFNRLLSSEFKDYDVFFFGTKEAIRSFKNHSKYDGGFIDGTKVYKCSTRY